MGSVDELGDMKLYMDDYEVGFDYTEYLIPATLRKIIVWSDPDCDAEEDIEILDKWNEKGILN
jgi:hypothetical protein